MEATDLIDRWIVPDPVKSDPEEARVKDFGIQVWAILNLLHTDRLPKSEIADSYGLPPQVIDGADVVTRQDLSPLKRVALPPIV